MGYMREYWVQVHQSPIVYRYIDWSITVPLQMIEFNLILKAAGKTTTAAGFWKLLLGTVMMLAFGYMGEESIIPAWPGFAVGMAGWGFILFEIFSGEAGGLAGDCSPHVAQSFNTMRMIVTVGWAIYPAGYLFGYLLGPWMTPSSTWCTTLLTSSTRSHSCSHAGLAPRLTLQRRRLCWLEPSLLSFI